MARSLNRCLNCSESSSMWEEENKYPIFKKTETVLQSNKSSYEKKVALFNCSKDMEVDKLKANEERRINCRELQFTTVIMNNGKNWK